MRVLVLVVALLGALLAPVAGAAEPEPRFTMAEIEAELMCPTCQSRLDMSSSPAADRIRAYVDERRRLGWTKEQVKEALVADFGPAVLAAPPTTGGGLVAWGVPIAAGVVGVGVVALVARSWRRRRPAAAPASAPAAAPLDPGLDERIDAELRRLDDEG